MLVIHDNKSKFPWIDNAIPVLFDLMLLSQSFFWL